MAIVIDYRKKSVTCSVVFKCEAVLLLKPPTLSNDWYLNIPFSDS